MTVLTSIFTVTSSRWTTSLVSTLTVTGSLVANPRARSRRHRADSGIDLRERLCAWHRVIAEREIAIHRQPWKIAVEQVDRGAALERKHAVGKHAGRDLSQQPCRPEIHRDRKFNRGGGR